MYERKSCLRARQQGKLIEHFVVGATARAASEVVGVNVKTATAFYMRLRQLIGGKQQSFELSGPDSIVYTDTFRSYNALDVSDFHHMRINHSELFANRQNHINGIENFWNQTKRYMRKFNGIK
jgi:transposase-like protein